MSMSPSDKTKEELELLSIEAGAQDTYWREDGMLEVYTDPTAVEQVKKVLGEKGVLIESAALQWIPKERISISEKDKEAAEKLFLALDESEAVQEIYANIKD